MNDILDEISNDVEEEKLVNILSKFLPYAIFVVVSIIAVTIIWIYSNNRINEKAINASHDFNISMKKLSQKNNEEAINILDDIFAKNNSGYGFISGFKKASILIEQKKYDEAVKTYDKLSKDGNDIFVKNLAKLLAVSCLIEFDSSNSKIEERISKSLNENNPLYPLALINKIKYLIINNKYKEAEKVTDILATTEKSNESLKNKAKIIKTILKNK